MSARSDAAAGSAAGFILGALGGAMLGNGAAEYTRSSHKTHDKAMMIGAVVGSFLGAVSLAAAATPERQPQLQARFP